MHDLFYHIIDTKVLMKSHIDRKILVDFLGVLFTTFFIIDGLSGIFSDDLIDYAFNTSLIEPSFSVTGR